MGFKWQRMPFWVKEEGEEWRQGVWQNSPFSLVCDHWFLDVSRISPCFGLLFGEPNMHRVSLLDAVYQCFLFWGLDPGSLAADSEAGWEEEWKLIKEHQNHWRSRDNSLMLPMLIHWEPLWIKKGKMGQRNSTRDHRVFWLNFVVEFVFVLTTSGLVQLPIGDPTRSGDIELKEDDIVIQQAPALISAPAEKNAEISCDPSEQKNITVLKFRHLESTGITIVARVKKCLKQAIGKRKKGSRKK